MRKHLYYTAFAALLAILTVVSCKKDKEETNPTNNNNTQTACNGMNLCFKLDGTEESHNATFKVLTDRYRVYWEEGSGTSYKNIEMDIYGTTTGSYTITANPSSGQGGFQYFDASGKNIQGQSGTIEVTAVSSDKISGTFTITADDGNGNTVNITDGNFVNVPK